MSAYIHGLGDWPHLRWDADELAALLATARYLQGKLLGQTETLGFQVREEVGFRALSEEVVKTSEIEGETLDVEQVRSSIARRLGIDIGGMRPSDRHVDGIVEMMLDATRHHAASLTVERLHRWHASLFPTGRSGPHSIVVGKWRDDREAPMQVVSGPAGRERVHFEAPAAARLEHEMERFIDWFNRDTTMEPVLKAAHAHFWFVTIHPFADGNGRIARAIAEMCLARSEDSVQRFYSMSAQIREERADYYRILEQAQQGSLDITPWMAWFLRCLTRAIERARASLTDVIARAHFWDSLRGITLNERQRLMINRLLEGFDGKLTTSRWAALAKTSQDTALRDIQQLVARGVLVRSEAAGRSTSYELARL